MLGYVLARVGAAIPPTVVLPPLIGSHASLNLFVRPALPRSIILLRFRQAPLNANAAVAICLQR
jgi:hypothetical protein